MSTRGIKKWALLLTFWMALHTASLRAQTVLYSGTSPAVLQMEGTSGILESIGTEGTGSLSLSGAGTRMIWYPGKAAFRAGRVASTDWDDVNIGAYSTAFGRDTTASGLYSMAFGISTTASGDVSMAFGGGTTASGNTSIAFGNASTANETGATAFGYHTLASGLFSTASGYQTTASGYGSMAFGVNTIASGLFSTAWGGNFTTASGYYATAAGLGTTAQAYDSFVLGRYNTGGGTTNSWVTSEALFEVGNGTSSTSKSDALLLDKSGNLTVGTVKATKFISSGATSSSGTDAVAFGKNTTASGAYSTASGYGATASGSHSVAMGTNSTASGLNSVALGTSALANNNFSTALGFLTTSSAYASTAFGNHTTASGSTSTAMGNSTTASGSVSTAMGSSTIASGSVSTAMGVATTASGDISTSAGWFTKAQAYADFVTGRYNTGGGTTSSWVSTEPLFEVGNGTSTTNTSDALLLDKSGNLTVSSVQAASFHTSASAYDSFVVGRFNTGGGATSSWNPVDPLFEVGNGTSSTSKTDALLVDKSGNEVVQGAISAGGAITAQPGGDIPMFAGY